MARTYRRSTLSYFVEFIIIIAGIMVSFLLNEWRAGKNMEEKKFHLLLEIQEDLKMDSLVLDISINFYKTMVRSHDSLLSDRNREFEIDSLNSYLDHFVSYFPFEETATTYQKILNSQDFTFDSEDTLIAHYIRLHNLTYPNLHEWIAIDKEFVLQQALPYMDEHAPFIYPTPSFKSFDGQVFYELRKEDAFMNLIKSGQLYKTATLNVCQRVQSYVNYIKSGVDKRIAEIQDS